MQTAGALISSIIVMNSLTRTIPMNDAKIEKFVLFILVIRMNSNCMQFETIFDHIGGKKRLLINIAFYFIALVLVLATAKQ